MKVNDFKLAKLYDANIKGYALFDYVETFILFVVISYFLGLNFSFDKSMVLCVVFWAILFIAQTLKKKGYINDI